MRIDSPLGIYYHNTVVNGGQILGQNQGYLLGSVLSPWETKEELGITCLPWREETETGMSTVTRHTRALTDAALSLSSSLRVLSSVPFCNLRPVMVSSERI